MLGRQYWVGKVLVSYIGISVSIDSGSISILTMSASMYYPSND